MHVMANAEASLRRQRRGSIVWLPSGSARVQVYAGVDPVSGREVRLHQVVKAQSTRRATEREAGKVLTKLLNQVDERRNPRTTATMNQLLDRWIEMLDVARRTHDGYVREVECHIKPTIGHLQVARVNAETVDALYASLRRCRDRCGGRAFIAHRTDIEHKCDEHSPRRMCAKTVLDDPAADCRWCRRVCGPHVCKPLAPSSVRVLHAVLSGALSRAVRWGWISVNPLDQVEVPSAPAANPKPPTSAEAARIASAAWEDADWGTLVWLLMVTGARRGEISGLRWSGLDLDAGVVMFDRSVGQIGRETWEKDTKTHQNRRVTLDSETVEVLREHRQRCYDRAAQLGVVVRPEGFVFSLAPDCSTWLKPTSISQRYRRLVNRLGIDTHLHCLRHYSATELIAAGVDPRTVAGRLGHAGGGATTLRVYSAWVAEADQRAATSLAARMSPMSKRSRNASHGDAGRHASPTS
jgi:integrase